MGNNFDNTTAIRDSVNGSFDDAATLLGPVFKMPKAGVIRPGIKVLKKNCSQDEQKIYERMLSEGATWDEIDRKLGTDDKGKSKLIPSNADYFTIRPEDCKNHDDVKRLHDLYADDDGKIRSLPVWFSVNEWYNIIPHGLRVFGKQKGLLFHSDFIEYRDSEGRITGSQRICRFPVTQQQITLAPAGNKRPFGGRKMADRPCDPENCNEYQTGQCKFGGAICCHIPGVKGIGVWLIPTTSWYSLVNIKSTLEIVASLTRGRIAGLVEPSSDCPSRFRTVFRLKKVTETVSMITQSGDSQKVEQDLIHLDVDIDLTELAAHYNSQRMVTTGLSSMKLLNGHSAKELKLTADVKNEDILNNTSLSEKAPGSDQSKPAETKKEVTKTAAELFDILAEDLKSDDKALSNNLIRGKLVELTGKNSFFDLSEEEAGKAIRDYQNSRASTTCTKDKNADLPAEVKEFMQVLSGMYGNGGSNELVLGKLKELTGVDSFEQLTVEKAKNALDKLTASVLNNY